MRARPYMLTNTHVSARAHTCLSVLLSLYMGMFMRSYAFGHVHIEASCCATIRHTCVLACVCVSESVLPFVCVSVSVLVFV